MNVVVGIGCRPSNAIAFLQAVVARYGMVTVDEKGQMVLPKTIRDKAKIQLGGMLNLIGWK